MFSFIQSIEQMLKSVYNDFSFNITPFMLQKLNIRQQELIKIDDIRAKFETSFDNCLACYMS